MNPYLEQDEVWHDFHEKFLPAAAELLVPQVRPDYIVKLDEHVYIHELPEEPRRLAGRADVDVGRAGNEPSGGPATGVLEAPVRVRLPVQDVDRVNFLEVRDRSGRELIAVIELLSPSNKRPGPDRDQYLGKRAGLLDSRAHLIEIDLLRGGRPMPLDDRPGATYSVLVSRAEDRPNAGFWALSLGDRLSTIPVPLRPPHGDARLDLQAVLDRVCDASGYEDYLDRGMSQPPLTAEEAAWARSFLPQAE
jgi:hypothetical protein